MAGTLLGTAGVGSPRLAADQERQHATRSRAAPGRACSFIYVVDTNDPVEAREAQHIYFEQAMGTHQTREHLEKSYFFGSVDEIVARRRDLKDGGCEYNVLGPTSDDPAQLDLLHNLVIAQVNGQVNG